MYVLKGAAVLSLGVGHSGCSSTLVDFARLPTARLPAASLSDRRVTVPRMKLTDEYWQQIAAHTTTSDGTSADAPWPVQVQIAALVGDSTIEASVASFDGTGPSIWTVTLITTDGRLIRLRMAFDAEQYDLDQYQRVAEPLDGSVYESWVRRLSDAERIEIRSSRTRPRTRDALDVAGVSLIFRDGVAVDLGVDQLAMTMYDDRRLSDRIVELVRHRTGL